ARIGVVDKIFTRIGASDDLTSGQSTFMVEMSEVADILRNATRRSLVILDEVGRGTSTFDGISIARAVAEYISQSKQLSCKTLFATHYHELIELEQELEGVKNYSVAVKRYGDSVKFLRKIVPGGVDDSYGIEVAKLAGIPDRVVKRAKELLAQMETSQKQQLNKALMAADDEQLSFEELEQQKLIKRLRQIDLDELTPRECMMALEELKGFLN
ncbi:MAG TPA: DNA mismatch repair protein MutS, partial [Oscillospiraceae bacterium]|nr:DNA mismatch repair protein MutS [Oscillospiraceae bacterium]